MTSEGLGEMFEGDYADTCTGKFPLVSLGGRAEGLACADPGARTPIGASGILCGVFLSTDYLNSNKLFNIQAITSEYFFPSYFIASCFITSSLLGLNKISKKKVG